MKRSDSKFLLRISPLCMVIASVLLMSNDAVAARASVTRGAPVASARRTVTASVQTVSEETTNDSYSDTDTTTSEPEEIVNKSDKFGGILTSDTSSFDSGFDDLAAQIRQQNAALQAKESTSAYQARQNVAAATGKNACDTGLRKCMQAECGKDFTKCALDGDTIMGDKFNKCRRDLECTGEEFKLFTNEIKADRDLNVKLSSYTNVIDCGNAYNKCMVSECGTNFSKCLGKPNADRAIQNCSAVAKECVEQDSGLASRFGTAIGKLREVAETEVKADEERMYELRDLMRKQCEHMGASFDERSFDCVYNVKFFAGDEQVVPMASRNMYAGDTFVCMQEFFGINATTYKENAYRETRAQTAASSAMLGSGLGTAAGLITSGAIGRALDTQKAKKALDAAKNPKDALKQGLQETKEIVQEGAEISDTVSSSVKKSGEAANEVVDAAASGYATYKGAPELVVKKNQAKAEAAKAQADTPTPATTTTYTTGADGSVHAKTTFDVQPVKASVPSVSTGGSSGGSGGGGGK